MPTIAIGGGGTITGAPSGRIIMAEVQMGMVGSIQEVGMEVIREVGMGFIRVVEMEVILEGEME